MGGQESFLGAEWTVVRLQRYLALHKQPTTGKKEKLINRCKRHSVKCVCLIGVEETSATSFEQDPCLLDSLNEYLPSLTWTSSLESWPQFTHSTLLSFKATDKHLKQGYNLFKSNKVENMLVSVHDGLYYCKGRVSPSMKKQRYLTSVKLDETRVVTCDCTCAAGKGKCKHAMALLYALVDYLMSGLDSIPEDLACTSQPRQWGRVSSKPVTASVTSFSELAPLTVDHNPDHPDAAVRQAERSKKRLEFCCLPVDSQPLTRSRMLTLAADHSFWKSIIATSSEPDAAEKLPKDDSVDGTQPSITKFMIASHHTTRQQESASITQRQHVNQTGSVTSSGNNRPSKIPVPSAALQKVHVKEEQKTLPTKIPVKVSDKRRREDDICETTSEVKVIPHGSGVVKVEKSVACDRMELERKTRGQGMNGEWMRARKGVITASIVGSIWSLKSTTSRTPLVNTINQVDVKDLSAIPAIQHGRKHEKSAAEYYESLTGTRVEERGLMLHSKYNWLGASVDGYVCSPTPKCIEIKCPLVSNKDPAGSRLCDLAKHRKYWFLVLNSNKLSLRKTHKYYYQVQMQMSCLEVDVCDFFVYLCDSQGKFIDCHLETIAIDHDLVGRLIAKCKLFYEDYIFNK